MKERVCELEGLEVQLETVWEETRVLYEEELEIWLLQRELEQAERWLSSYESSLLAEDYGVGLQGVFGPERGGGGGGRQGYREVKRGVLAADHQHGQQVELQLQIPLTGEINNLVQSFLRRGVDRLLEENLSRETTKKFVSSFNAKSSTLI